MYVRDGFVELCCGSVFNGAKHTAVTVVVICHHDILVAIAGWLWEASCLVGIYYLSWFRGGQATEVCALEVDWLYGEIVVIVWDVVFGAFCVLLLCIHVAHCGCFEGRWEEV